MLAIPNAALAVNKVLYRRDYLSNQYQASINEMYERPFKLFRVHFVHFVQKGSIHVCSRGICFHKGFL